MLHLEELEGTCLFRPAGRVAQNTHHSLRLTKEFAAFTAEEFTDVFGVEPSILKVPEISLDSNGPRQKKVKFFVVGLEGLSLEVMMSCRKVTLEYFSGIGNEELYLRPEDQLVNNQGTMVFGHCFDQHNSLPPAFTVSIKHLRQKHVIEVLTK